MDSASLALHRQRPLSQATVQRTTGRILLLEGGDGGLFMPGMLPPGTFGFSGVVGHQLHDYRCLIIFLQLFCPSSPWFPENVLLEQGKEVARK